MANVRDERHRYGQHYTPHEVARLLAAFALRSSDDLVFDPSCGDGRLLEEAMRLKKQLFAQGSGPDPTSSHELFGIERSAPAIEVARRTGACLASADFFDVEPGASSTRLTIPHELLTTDYGLRTKILPSGFDAIIGNPPYIRQEVIGARDKRRIEACLARDRKASPTIFWPRWSGRSDIYVYFFAHSIRFLKSDGRLVFLTASSWLDAGYGAALREFILSNFRIIAVVESAAESFFTDASINTCITVLERKTDSRARDENSVRFVRFNRTLSEILADGHGPGAKQTDKALHLAREIERCKGAPNNDSYRVRVIGQSKLAAVTPDEPGRKTRAAIEQGWGKYLRASEVFFRLIERGRSRLQNLSRMARVRFGVKTGANEFFYVSDALEEPKKGKRKGGGAGKPKRPNGLLALGAVASVRRGITTGANEFFYLKQQSTAATRDDTFRPPATAHRPPQLIESRFLSPVIFSLKEIPGILLKRAQARRVLFNCSLTPAELAGTRALSYIASGERAGYHLRPTCSSRGLWYSVASERKPAPLIFPSKVGERWLVALNRARVFEDKKLYGVFPARGVSAPVLAALLNSTWARYYAELTCRQMTGAQAIADIDVNVAERILLPDPRELSMGMKKRLETALAELARRPVYSIFEEVKRVDRRRLDALTLEAIGFSARSEREALLDQLYEAVTELVRARLAKADIREEASARI
ncbi:MAG: N-6 DNA methylase [Blastocatellia bacterium]